MGSKLTVTELKHYIIDAKHRGIHFYLQDGRLKSKSKAGAITSNDKRLVKENKQQLVNMLSDYANTSSIEITAQSIKTDHLSFSQSRIVFLNKLKGTSSDYNMVIPFTVAGYIDLVRLEASFQAIVERHETLRTTYYEDDGEFKQLVKSIDQVEFKLCTEYRESYQDEQRQLDIDENISAEANYNFNLESELMIRAKYVQYASQVGLLVINIHHIASDGWSMEILRQELSTLCNAHSLDQGKDMLPELPLCYRDYVYWQHKNMHSNDIAKQIAYWSQGLSGIPETHALPVKVQRHSKMTRKGRKIESSLTSCTSKQLNELAKSLQMTPFMLCHALFSLIISRYSHHHDIVVGTPLSGRLTPSLKNMMGLFVNTVALRTNTNFELVGDFFNHVKEVHIGAQSNQSLPFDKVVEALNIDSQLTHNPIFQMLLTVNSDYGLDSNAADKTLVFPDATLTVAEQYDVSLKFELEVDFNISDSGGVISWQFDKELFDDEFIQALDEHFHSYLYRLLNATDILHMPLADVVAVLEQQKIRLTQPNEASIKNPTYQCIHSIIEAQVNAQKDKVAVVCAEQKMSYQTLNEKANQVANYLREAHGVGPGKLIGLCTRRSIDMVIGMLGILKAGGAYVPIDPEYPVERINYMLTDSNISTVLSEHCILTRPYAVDSNATWLALDKIELDGYCPCNLDIEYIGLQSSDLAYIIYTSGSTGRPKGVMVEHRNVHALMTWSEKTFSSSGLRSVLAATSICFDISVFEIFAPLSVGGQVWLAPDLLTVNQKNIVTDVSLINTVPSVMTAFMEMGDLPESVEVVCLVGEPVKQTLVDALYQRGVQKVYDLYGPTEDTVYSTCALRELNGVANIGYPIHNTYAYVLDEKRALVPIGAIGTLYLGGSGVTRGYLNQPELTAQKFLPNPFTDNDTDRMYNTGDLVRYRHDGTLQYLGRSDEQVKLNGLRIECGEVAHQLNRCQGVEQAEVLAREDQQGKQHLVAYLTRSSLEEASPDVSNSALQAQLAETLPSYMVPSIFIWLDKWPMTANGKLDKKALPTIDAFITEQVYIAPTTEVEQDIAAIFSKLLAIELCQVSREGDFFALGGHSLLAVRLVAEIRKLWGKDVSVRDVFELRTVKDLAIAVEKTHTSALCEPKRLHLTEAPLSFSQQRVWFIDKLQGQSSEYHLFQSFQVQGVFEHKVAESVFCDIIARHEVLRSVYLDSPEGPRQKVLPTWQFKLGFEDLSGHPEVAQSNALTERIEAEQSRPFNLSEDVMLRASYIATGDKEGVLLFNMHHIASDGWSLNILIDEFMAGYHSLQQGTDYEAKPLALQYSDYVHWQRAWLDTQRQQVQLDYWQQQLADVEPIHGLRLDKPRPPQKQYQGAKVCTSINTGVAQGIKALAKAQGMTPFMLVHGLIAQVLARHSNRSEIVIGTPVANRADAGLSSLIGFFVNTVALKVCTHHDTLGGYLHHIKQVHLDAQAHQDVPFEQVVERLNLPYSSAHNPVFQIMLTTSNDYGEGYKERDERITLGNVELTAIASQHSVVKFDLEIDLRWSDEGLSVIWHYDTALFDGRHIEQLAAHLVTLMSHFDAGRDITAVVEQPLYELDILTQSEQTHLLETLKGPVVDYPSTHCVHTLFEAQVVKECDKVAVQFGSETLSYGALNARANQVAHYLRAEHGVGPGDLVGLCLTRSVEMVVGMLAILKAGGAYVPIDPAYPEGRISYILNDTNLSLVLSETEVIDNISCAQKAIWVCIKETNFSFYDKSNVDVEHSGVGASDTAYVIYTSGSTGKPKGVVVEHKCLSNYTASIHENYKLSVDDVVLQYSTMSFDIFIEEWLCAFANGATLAIAGDAEVQDSKTFVSFCQSNNVTVASLPTAFWHQLDSSYLKSLETYLRLVIVGGEAIQQSNVKSWLADVPLIKLCNTYGPTETTITATSFTLSCDYLSDAVVPIGTPNPNYQLLILNKDMQLTPKGAIGELYIQGDGLAKGYLNNPVLTESSFISKSIAGREETRMYKTGDLVRSLPCGNIEFIGRADKQVKVRGFRVELNEIQNILLQLEHISAAHVTTRGTQESNLQITAYIVPSSNFSRPDTHQTLLNEVKVLLTQELPMYMVPTAWMVIEALPLTINGKVNDDALPPADMINQQQEFAAPDSEISLKLTGIWADLLGIDQRHIGVKTNFFDLGGHSLLMVRLASAIRSEFEVEIPIKTLFEQPTIKEIEQQISEKSLLTVIAEREAKASIKLEGML